GYFDAGDEVDLAVAQADGTVAILLGNGDATFTTAGTETVGAFPQAIGVGDLDGDGNSDLVVANVAGFSVSVLLGAGDGTFAAAVDHAVDPLPVWLTLADVDGENGLDIITANDLSDTVSILLNNGDGTFADAVSIDVGADGASWVAAGDLDGVNGEDLVVTNTGDDTVTVLLNDGSGSFPTRHTFAVGNAPRSVAIVDLDLDGNLDLAVGNEGAGILDTLSILMNNGDGTFAAAVNSSDVDDANAMAVADFNSDGIMDLATVDADGDIALFGNNADATFDLPVTLAPLGQPEMFAIGDFDGDGDSDVVTADLIWNGLSLFLNETVPPAAAPNAPDLLPEFDTGLSDSDNVTRINNDGVDNTLQFSVSGVVAGSTVTLYVGSTVIGQAVADSDTVVITTDGNILDDGTYGFSASYTVGADESARSVGTAVTIDTQDPVFSSTPTLEVPLGPEYTYDAQSDAEGLGALYELTVTPTGMTIDPATGVISWTPIDEQVGDNDVTILVTDLAGNQAEQVFTLTVDCFLVIDPVTTHGVPANAFSIVTGDFDGNGNTDAAVSFALGYVMVLLGNGDGTFTNGATPNVGASPRSMVTGDLDGDGDLDLVTANYGSDNVSVLLNNGDGTFADAVNIDVGWLPMGVELADMDGVNGLDIVTANTGSDDVSVLLNNGDGTFGDSTEFDAADSAQSIAVGDIDGDGDQDVITADLNSSTVAVLLGDGAGALLLDSYVTVGRQAQWVVLADLNNDGLLDIASANLRAGQSLSVLIGAGDGTFADAVNSDIGSQPHRLIASDVNGDGLTDVVAASLGDESLVVRTSNGDGTFADPYDLAMGVPPAGLAAGDLNGDGVPDLVACASVAENVFIFMNQTTPPPAAPQMPDLKALFDTGPDDADNVTNRNNLGVRTLQFLITGTTAGATVLLYADDTLIGQATAAGDTTTITTDGLTELVDGTYAITVTQTVYCTSVHSRTMTLTVDATTPTITSLPYRFVVLGETYTYDIQSDEEGNDGVVYTLPSMPDGMTRTIPTGEVTWTPTEAQRGTHDVTVRVRDLAGNYVDQSFTVSVLLGGNGIAPIPILGEDGVITILTRLTRFVDPDSDRITITYTGPGELLMGTLYGHVEYIIAVGQIDNLTIRVQRRPGGDGVLNVGTFVGDNITSFISRNVYFTGGIGVVSDGGASVAYASRFIFGGMSNAADLVIGSTPENGVTVRADTIDTTGDVTVTGAARSLRIIDLTADSVAFTGGVIAMNVKGDWTTTNGATFGDGLAGVEQTPLARRLRFKGDLSGPFAVNNQQVRRFDVRGDTTATLALVVTEDTRHLRIRGETNGTLDLAGVRRVRVADLVGEMTIGDSTNIRVKGELSGQLTIGVGRNVRVQGAISGAFAAESVVTFLGQSNLTGTVSFTLDPDSIDDLAVVHFTILGRTEGATIRSSASIGSMLFSQALVDSSILVGVLDTFDPAAGLPADGQADVLEAVATRVGSITTQLFGDAAFDGSMIVGHHFAMLRLDEVFFNNDGTTFGVAAQQIDTLSFIAPTGRIVLTGGTAFGADEGPLETADFAVNQLPIV
ncbi:MAG: VCBS repeat-containing protein, partial [Phycisphaerales bacterium]|nr:VCBS repeat-containing protein [Phycisphaerales bacterium]